jgi:hypothetical protein
MIINLRRARRQLREFADLPYEGRCYVGFRGPEIESTKSQTGKDWRLFYLDEHASTWLLVQADGILVEDRQEDAKAPFGYRAWMWVSGDAEIREGTGSARSWLSGSFTRASDFTPSVGGGTFAQPTGPFCGTGCTRLSRYPR